MSRQEHSAPAPRSSQHLRTAPSHGDTTVFDASHQTFYEGKWIEPDYSDGSLRNWLVRKQRFFLSHLPRSSTARVLDLGCGAGWKLFTRAGNVVGIDLSRQSLATAKTLYHDVASGYLSHLPFRDGSFDTVVSCDVLGHIPPEFKQQVLNEIYRVLKPGGRTLHYIETEGDDPLTNYAKQDVELYRRHIIGPEGHEGLESPAENFQRFRDAGFRPSHEQAAYRMLMYVGRIRQLYDNEYARRSKPVAAIVGLSKLLTSVAPLEIASNLGMAAVLEVTDRVLPASWGNGAMVEYVK